MITKEEFIELIEKYNKNDEAIDEIDKLIPGFFESVFIDFGWYCFEKLLSTSFNEEGKDWIDWWLYDSTPGHGGIIDNGINKEIETVDDLWELVKDYRI